jgi:hypothetical protein
MIQCGILRVQENILQYIAADVLQRFRFVWADCRARRVVQKIVCIIFRVLSCDVHKVAIRFIQCQ